MSSRSKFVVLIAVMLVVVVIIEYRMPQRFQWKPTFLHDDPQPFGCMVFDSVLAQTMPRGYTVTPNTVWQMRRDSTLSTPHGLLFLCNESLTTAHLDDLLSLADSGHVVLVTTTGNMWAWEDTLDVVFSYNTNFNIKQLAGKAPEKQAVSWTERGDYRPAETVCTTYETMISYHVTLGDSLPFVTLAKYQEDTIAVSLRRGKGELIILTAPLLMTNYAMLSHDNGAVFIHRLMNRMKHLPVIRSEGLLSRTTQNSESPFSVFLQHPPLRWALYLTMMGIVLFCVFTARRRQRPIPVIPQPQNGNREFVRLIGTLYWQEGNHQGLLQKKLAYTAEVIRRQTGLDIMDSDTEADTLAQLARLTGSDQQELAFVVRNIKKAVLPECVITEAEMKSFVAELDKILNGLCGP